MICPATDSLAEPCSALLDLPTSCLHHISIHLTPEAAARTRSTCQQLQQVVDATWEPEEVPIPPHRRDTPLTFEQVEAQLPPDEPAPEDWISDDDDDDDAYNFYTPTDEFGRALRCLDVFGPLLTRLTANQVINLLPQDQPVVCWEKTPLYTHIGEYTTKQDKLRELAPVIFGRSSHSWPPWVASKEGSRCRMLQDDTSFCIDSTCLPRPAAYRSVCDPHPYDLGVGVPYRYWWCLVTSDTSCRAAFWEEERQFRNAESPSEVAHFDVHLCCCGKDRQELYAFLAPTQFRHTGRPRRTRRVRRFRHQAF